MIYDIASRKEAAGTNKAGFKTGVAERLAAGALVLCPTCDHDTLAEELHRQLSRESIVFDVSEILAEYIEASIAEPHQELPAVVYITTDATVEPADELMDRAIRMIAGLTELPRPGVSPRAVSPSEVSVLSAFVTSSNAPAQRWLYSLLRRILFRRPPASAIFLQEIEGFWGPPRSGAVVGK